MRLQRLRAVLPICAIASAAIVAAAPPDLFDEIYAKGRPFESSLRTLTARFIETTTSTLLTRPLVARGTLAVVRPDRVVLQYDEPDRRTVLIEGDVMRRAWPAQSVDQKSNIGAAQRRIQQYFVGKTPAELRGHFDIGADAAADAPGTWLVTLSPKRKQIREGLSRLELWLDQTTVTLAKMRMTFPNGDTKQMAFEDVRVNVDIDPSMFQIKAP